MSLDTTQYPTRPACFGEPGFTNASCTIPSPSMIDFLNITSFDMYRDTYCLNPPQDSCAFGYCPNPDIASPAVRVATYVSTICFSIAILYSDDDITSSFYAQMLQVYSFVIAVIAAIAEQQLTRLHAIFAVVAAGSPLSLYLLIYALRSIFKNGHRLDCVFGDQVLNRVLVLAIVPAWLAVLVFICLQADEFRFQQAACDAVFHDHLVGKFFYGPLLVFIDAPLGAIIAGIAILGTLALSWVVCILRQYKEIWARKENGERRLFPLTRIWRKTIDHYPFVQFCIVIVIPMFLWIAVLEDGALFTQEHFVPTYGQLLAIFVAVPPLVQLIFLLPYLIPWFVNLWWVRLLSGRWKKTYLVFEYGESGHSWDWVDEKPVRDTKKKARDWAEKAQADKKEKAEKEKLKKERIAQKKREKKGLKTGDEKSSMHDPGSPAAQNAQYEPELPYDDEKKSGASTRQSTLLPPERPAYQQQSRWSTSMTVPVVQVEHIV